MRTVNCIVVWLLLLFVRDAVAQVCPECDARQDFTCLTVKTSPSVTVPSSKVGAYYSFMMNYDYGVVDYTATEFRKNTSVIALNNWCRNKRTRNLDAGDLTNASRTEDILLATGDVLSSYREFSWYNPVDSTAVEENNVVKSFALYPNPTSAHIDISVELNSTEDPTTVAIYDPQGALVFMPVISHVGSDLHVGCDFESSGWYTVVIYQGSVPVASTIVHVTQ